MVRQALERGLDPDRLATGDQRIGDATAAYRERQLRAATALLARLRRQAGGSRDAVARAYRAAIFAVDRVTLAERGGAAASIDTRFGGLHERAIAALAGNLERSLREACDRAGANIAGVFARADMLEGALPVTGIEGGVRFIGRRVDDPWRRLALEELGAGHVALDTRRQISANLIRRLVDEGITDALTGFVDRAGRRWSLERYTEMVARTTTREATSRGAVNRLEEHGLDLVEISSHPHAADVCTPYDGETFSRSGDHPTYPRLEELPPFHPNCRHVLTPAGANFEEYERELGLRSADG